MVEWNKGPRVEKQNNMQMRLYGTVEKVSEVRRMGWVISFLGRPGRT